LIFLRDLSFESMIEGSNIFKLLYPLFLSSFPKEKDFEPLKSEVPVLNFIPKFTI